MKPIFADDFIQVMERSGEIARIFLDEQITAEHLLRAIIWESFKDKKLRRRLARLKIAPAKVKEALPFSLEAKAAINQAISSALPGKGVTALHLLKGLRGDRV